MKVKSKVLGSTAALAMLVLAFQNCSPVNFGTGEQRAGKSGAVAPPVDDGVADIDDRDPVVEDNTPQDNNTNPDYDYADNSINNPNVPPRSGDVYRAKCAETGDKSFLDLPAGAHISGNIGVGRYRAPSIHAISGNHDEIVVLRDGGSGMFHHLSGNTKLVVICGFSMKSISGNADSIVLVNSHVEKLSGNHPRLKLVDSTIGSQSGNIGEILQ